MTDFQKYLIEQIPGTLMFRGSLKIGALIAGVVGPLCLFFSIQVGCVICTGYLLLFGVFELFFHRKVKKLKFQWKVKDLIQNVRLVLTLLLFTIGLSAQVKQVKPMYKAQIESDALYVERSYVTQSVDSNYIETSFSVEVYELSETDYVATIKLGKVPIYIFWLETPRYLGDLVMFKIIQANEPTWINTLRYPLYLYYDKTRSGVGVVMSNGIMTLGNIPAQPRSLFNP